MDTSNLKKFAVEARNSLRKGVDDCLKGLGFDQNGHVEEDDRPRAVDGGCIWRGNFISDNDFFDKWTALENAIVNHEGGAKVGYKAVVEEAGYTWFNRFVAIRILQKNKLIEPQLVYLPGTRVPMIVENARRGIVPQMAENDLDELKKILQDHSKVLEQFNLLIVAFCHSTPILSKCFGHINDYTELLLPQNVLAMGGFIDLLNNTNYLTDEDFAQTELIGWLYQFYISEKKDEVFASFKNKKKAEADDIPAATQIFTPNWIVKYMVQNTLGRIYLDNKPSSDLASKWKYLVDKSGSDDASIYKFSELEQLKVADFACGSGHILNEFFDMLYDFYLEDGASAKDAIECIFQYNLVGIDLDTRAKQLSMFSLLLKACQKRAEFVNAQVLPRVYDMPEPITDKSWLRDTLPHYFLGASNRVMKESLEALALMESAKNLGSTMVFNISTETRNAIAEHIDIWNGKDDERLQNLVKSFLIILALTGKYSAIAMNPPYMGNANMNAELSDYVKANYSNGKTDLATVFIEVQQVRTAENGLFAYIIPPSWMFLGAFEDLRKSIIARNSIQSLLHLSRGVFGADFGASSAVVKNAKIPDSTGNYYRLVERTFQEFEQSHLRMLFEQTLDNHDFKYKFKDYTKDDMELPYSDDGNKIYYPNVPQSYFEQIPGSPIGYWVSDNYVKICSTGKTVASYGSPKTGMTTGDNNRFLRMWQEVSKNKSSLAEIADKQKKWFPYLKGGGFRRWYGNYYYLVNWEQDGFELKNNFKPNGQKIASVRSEELYFKPLISWSAVSSGAFSSRLCFGGSLFDSGGSSLYLQDYRKYIFALLNGPIAQYSLNMSNPTMNYQPGDVGKVPVNIDGVENIEAIVDCNISISKSDWDAHETSWDFQKNELLAMDAATDDVKLMPQQQNLLEWRMDVYESKWERLFNQLHENEEELNRQFIKIYGLQDELTPDVPYDEVSILQQGEINVVGDRIEFNRDAIIKQFISYAVGCMMGRYRLDKDGLAIAHPGASAEEIAAYEYNGETWQIDDDGILPLMGRESGFADDATNRFKDFIRVAFGEENQNKNLSFVDQCLGKSVEDYFTKDFWADHKKMYQNRPIYWLFSSKKGAFKCIAYMHRMDKNTVEQIRQKYLLKYIDKLRNEEAALLADSANLSGADQKKLTKIQKNLKECEEYHVVLHDIADKRIEFDLDDGVVVNYAKFGEILAKIK